KNTGYFATGMHVLSIDFRRGKMSPVFGVPSSSEKVSHLQVDPDYDVLFVMSITGTMFVLDLSERAVLETIKTPPDPVHFLFNPAREKIVTITKDNSLNVVSVEDAKLEYSKRLSVLPGGPNKAGDLPLTTPIDLEWDPTSGKLVGSYLNAPGVLLVVEL
ncbi:MAG: hypothetical protein ACTSU5_17660, partial [Promethearchaeota archaeon]